MLCEIKKAEPKSKDEREEIFEFASGKNVLILKRKKGTVSGEHYHLGKAKSKNPEIFFLIKGKIEFYAEHVKTKEKQKTIVEENSLIIIPPMVYHKLKALTDIVFIELNNEPDKYDKDTVKDYK